ncbi:MAG: OsmC family protein [Candidatus Heimdallarchaeota archaeon]
MISTYRLIKNFQGVVDNGRTHTVVVDLPKNIEGEDLGPTALELAVMAYSGCIGTIFAKIAKKMRLDLEALEVIMDAVKGPEDKTVTSVKADIYVKSPASEEKLQKCIDLTLKTCPVGLIYDNASIPAEVILHKQ